MRTISLFSLIAMISAGSASAQLSPRLSEALDLQRAMVQQSPGDPEALNDLGNLYGLAGDWTEAEAAYRASLALDPTRATTHYNLALALQETDQLVEAAAAMEEAVALDPTNARALYQLGNIYMQRGERDLAIEAFARSFRVDPNLAVPEINPQVIDNAVLTESLIHAYDRRSRAAMAPRMYDKPDQITDMLIPERDLLEPPAELAEAEEAPSGTETRRLVTPDTPMFKPPVATPEELAAKERAQPKELDLEAAFGAAEERHKQMEASDDGWGADFSGWGTATDSPQTWEDVDETSSDEREKRIEERRLRRQKLREAARKRAEEAQGDDSPDGDDNR